jgi:RNA polymerase sigma-70 factor (ECF subfamily)
VKVAAVFSGSPLRIACEAVAIAAERLDELGDKYRDIFRMRFCDGYTETEIARRLNLKVATVKTRAYRARLALREALTERLAA